jgi:glycosyltransferase involved in cell wall biosynthesis
MQALAFNYSDTIGGASRAAYRIHRALLAAGVDSTMIVNGVGSDDSTVEGPTTVWRKARMHLAPYAGAAFMRMLGATAEPLLSPAIVPSAWHRRINASACDLVHLHWINGEMMSIADIGRISKPIVWTLHDMWAFSGAEHVNEDARWKDGYVSVRGIDVNRWVWTRKQRHWRRPMLLATPSRWLAECVRQSKLMHDWPVRVIHNPIDTEIWKPVEQSLARGLLGLPLHARILLFGTYGAHNARHKGFDLLQNALKCLGGRISDLHLVICGQMRPANAIDVGFPMHYVGHLRDDLTMRVLYSAADALVIPSRVDNLPNAGVEAMACGTPVVAFNTCGLPDIVQHQHTGYLASAFDVDDFAQGIQWVLDRQERLSELGLNARDAAVTRFSYPIAAQQYREAYAAALAM